MSLTKVLKFFKRNEPESLRDTLEELIEDSEESEPSIESDERQLLGNVLNLRDLDAYDVMIPRADIIALNAKSSMDELLALMVKNGLSRVPVYRDNLDNILGAIYIKDLLSVIQSKKTLTSLKPLIRDVMYIAPTMRTLDLLLEMRESGTKMAIVVDEYGGVDGLVTFSDLIEAIIGDIQDAHNQHTTAIHMTKKPDGSIVTDSRALLEDIDKILQDSLLPPNVDQEDIDTIGGVVTLLAGRVPTRGELIKHPRGYEFEIIEADPRRIKRLIIRKTDCA